VILTTISAVIAPVLDNPEMTGFVINTGWGFIKWASFCVATVFMSIVGWGIKVLSGNIKHNEEEIQRVEKSVFKVEKSLDSYKIEAANTFAKEESMQASLARVHDRIDDVSSDTKEILKLLAGRK